MMSNAFEEAFCAFLETQSCDRAYEALFTLARASFQAGWLAAGGDPPQSEHIFQILPGNTK